MENKKLTYNREHYYSRDLLQEDLWGSRVSAGKQWAALNELDKCHGKLWSASKERRLEAAKTFTDDSLVHWDALPIHFYEVGLKDADKEVRSCWLEKAKDIVLPDTLIREVMSSSKDPDFRAEFLSRPDVQALRQKDLTAPRHFAGMMAKAYGFSERFFGASSRAKAVQASTSESKAASLKR